MYDVHILCAVTRITIRGIWGTSCDGLLVDDKERERERKRAKEREEERGVWRMGSCGFFDVLGDCKKSLEGERNIRCLGIGIVIVYAARRIQVY